MMNRLPNRTFQTPARAIAFFTLLAFGFTQNTSAQIVDPLSLASPSPLVKEIKIPEALGTLEIQHLSQSGKPWVFYIQDAHAILDAQKNIQNLIGYLQENYGVDLVAVEGAKGKLDPTLLQVFPDPFVKEQVMSKYWERAELSGGELAALFPPKVSSPVGIKSIPTAFYGIENGDIYQKNYEAYLKALKNQAGLEMKLEIQKNELDEKRKHIYSQKLNEFHERVMAFREEKIGLGEWLSSLNQNALQGFPHLSRLFESLEQEKLESQENFEISLRKMAEGFKKKVLPKLAEEKAIAFNQAYQSYVAGQSDAAHFLLKLMEIAKVSGFSPKLTPAMKKVLGHQENLSHIKGTQLFEELESFILKEQKALMVTEEEKALSEKYEKWRLMRSLVHLELTRAEWVRVKSLSELGDRNVEPFLEFYRMAERRDGIFYENLEKLMKKEKSQNAVVLTGGFHSQGFQEALKKNDYSYAVILPKMNSLQGQELYKNVMQGKFSFNIGVKESLHEAFLQNAVLSLVSSLNEPDFRKNLKLWRDEVIRQLAQEGRLAEASRYTKYLDNLFKIYHEKFGNRIPKTKEEIIQVVKEELTRLGKETSENRWAQFESQFQTLKEGLQNLAQQKNLNKNSLTQLWQNLLAPQTAGLKSQLPLDVSGGFLIRSLEVESDLLSEGIPRSETRDKEENPSASSSTLDNSELAVEALTERPYDPTSLSLWNRIRDAWDFVFAKEHSSHAYKDVSDTYLNRYFCPDQTAKTQIRNSLLEALDHHAKNFPRDLSVEEFLNSLDTILKDWAEANKISLRKIKHYFGGFKEKDYGYFDQEITKSHAIEIRSPNIRTGTLVGYHEASKEGNDVVTHSYLTSEALNNDPARKRAFLTAISDFIDLGVRRSEARSARFEMGSENFLAETPSKKSFLLSELTFGGFLLGGGLGAGVGLNFSEGWVYPASLGGLIAAFMGFFTAILIKLGHEVMTRTGLLQWWLIYSEQSAAEWEKEQREQNPYRSPRAQRSFRPPGRSEARGNTLTAERDKRLKIFRPDEAENAQSVAEQLNEWFEGDWKVEADPAGEGTRIADSQRLIQAREWSKNRRTAPVPLPVELESAQEVSLDYPLAYFPKIAESQNSITYLILSENRPKILKILTNQTTDPRTELLAALYLRTAGIGPAIEVLTDTNPHLEILKSEKDFLPKIQKVSDGKRNIIGYAMQVIGGEELKETNVRKLVPHYDEYEALLLWLEDVGLPINMAIKITSTGVVPFDFGLRVEQNTFKQSIERVNAFLKSPQTSQDKTLEEALKLDTRFAFSKTSIANRSEARTQVSKDGEGRFTVFADRTFSNQAEAFEYVKQALILTPLGRSPRTEVYQSEKYPEYVIKKPLGKNGNILPLVNPDARELSERLEVKRLSFGERRVGLEDSQGEEIPLEIYSQKRGKDIKRLIRKIKENQSISEEKKAEIIQKIKEEEFKRFLELIEAGVFNADTRRDNQVYFEDKKKIKMRLIDHEFANEIPRNSEKIRVLLLAHDEEHISLFDHFLRMNFYNDSEGGFYKESSYLRQRLFEDVSDWSPIAQAFDTARKTSDTKSFLSVLDKQFRPEIGKELDETQNLYKKVLDRMVELMEPNSPLLKSLLNSSPNRSESREEVKPDVFTREWYRENGVDFFTLDNTRASGLENFDRHLFKKIDLQVGNQSFKGVLLGLFDGAGGSALIANHARQWIMEDNLFERALQAAPDKEDRPLLALKMAIAEMHSLAGPLAKSISDKLIGRIAPASTLSLVYIPDEGKKAYAGSLADSPILIFDKDRNLIFTSQRHQNQKGEITEYLGGRPATRGTVPFLASVPLDQDPLIVLASDGVLVKAEKQAKKQIPERMNPPTPEFAPEELRLIIDPVKNRANDTAEEIARSAREQGSSDDVTVMKYQPDLEGKAIAKIPALSYETASENFRLWLLDYFNARLEEGIPEAELKKTMELGLSQVVSEVRKGEATMNQSLEVPNRIDARVFYGILDEVKNALRDALSQTSGNIGLFYKEFRNHYELEEALKLFKKRYGEWDRTSDAGQRKEVMGKRLRGSFNHLDAAWKRLSVRDFEDQFQNPDLNEIKKKLPQEDSDSLIPAVYFGGYEAWVQELTEKYKKNEAETRIFLNAISEVSTTHNASYGFAEQISDINQGVLLKKQFAKMIEEKILKNERKMSFAIFGLGENGHESLDMLNWFYAVLKKYEDPALWTVQVVLFDIKESVLQKVEKLLNGSITKTYGKVPFKIKTAQANFLDKRSMLVVRDHFEKGKADFISQRHVTYGNQNSIVLHENNLTTLFKVYSATRNILLNAARSGSIYVVEERPELGFEVESGIRQEEIPVFGFPGLELMPATEIIPDWKGLKSNSLGSRASGFYRVIHPEAVKESEEKGTPVSDFLAAIAQTKPKSSSSRSESRVLLNSFMPGSEIIVDRDLLGVEDLILAAAEKNKNAFNLDFEREVNQAVKDLEELPVPILESYLYGNAQSLEAFVKFLDERINKSEIILTNAQLYEAVLGIRTLVVLGQRFEGVSPTSLPLLDRKKLEEATADLWTGIRQSEALQKAGKIDLVVDYPEPEIYETVLRNLQKFSEEGNLGNLHILGTQFHRGDWAGIQATVLRRSLGIQKPEEVMNQILKGSDQTLVSILSGNSIASQVSKILMMGTQLKNVPEEARDYVLALSFYIAMRFQSETPKYQQELLTQPELLREYLNRDARTSGMMSFQSSGILSINLYSLTLRFTASRAFAHAA